MPTKIIRTVIGGQIIETPVEVAASEIKETPKAKRGRPKKKEEPTPEADSAE